MHPPPFVRLLWAVVAGLGAACADASSPPTWRDGEGYRWAELDPGLWGRTGFRLLSPSRTGIEFENRVAPEQVETDRHYLNGSGVTTGDVDGDGRPDVYFAGSMGSRLYRNMGGLRFEDVTSRAGVGRDGEYVTGAVLADVDGDGDLDLLTSSLDRGVSLYRNDGTGVFTADEAVGLGSTKGQGSMTLALADVDGDGDLDLYVANYRERAVTDVFDLHELALDNTIEGNGREGDPPRLRSPYDRFYVLVEGEEGRPERALVGEPDQLFLNDGGGRFVEVEDAGAHFLTADGRPGELPRDWGLTARFQDLSGDGLPDLWVCNDFWTPDRVWINQGGAVFRAVDPRAARNFPFSSMAVATGDVNRDGHVDVFVTEMRSARHERQARQYVPWEPWPERRLDRNAQPQYNRNALYVARGDGTWLETSYYSGVEATEWSWATRFLDVDLDGWEDILVNTGFPYDLQDLDTQLRRNMDIARGMRTTLGLTTYPPYLTPNQAFRNERDLTFTPAGEDWGFEDDDISHGLAVADFDGDGDLDLAVSRMNAAAAIYENTGTAPRIAVRLRGRAPNTSAVGARVRLEDGSTVQSGEVVAGGDYLSGSDDILVFAAPRAATYRLRIAWPGGGRTTLEGLRRNRIYEVRQPPAAGTGDSVAMAAAPGDVPLAIFEDLSDRLDHRHRESVYDDFAVQPLLPVMLSREGPPVAWLDLEGDGDEDLLVGAARGGHPAAYENLGDADFRPMELGGFTDTVAADQTALIGWRDAEGAVIVAGSANFELADSAAPSAYAWRVGASGSVEEPQALQGAPSTVGPVVAADVDNDGDVDLFLGGRFVPPRYPTSASSRLFLNEDGRFTFDADASRPFAALGLVTAAVFSDVDSDGDPDLILAVEWGSLKLFRNDGGRFTDVTAEWGLDHWRGWWNGVATGDFDGDGRPDIVAGNLGLNSPYRARADHPLRLYYADFNWDGRTDVVDAFWDSAAEGYVPRLQLQDFASIRGTMLQNVRTNDEFAAATVEELLGLRAGIASYREIDHLESAVWLNRGGSFEARPLPPEAQLTAAVAPVVADMDADGREDLFLGQNLFAVRPRFPRLDGGRGLWLRGDGAGGFEAVPGQVSGVEMYGDQRGAAVADLDGDGRVDLVVTQNHDRTRLYRNWAERTGLRVRLEGAPDNRDGVGAGLRVVYADGSRGPLREVQAGSGYRSTNAAVQVLGIAPGRTVRAVEVRWPDGSVQTAAVEAGQTTLTIPRQG